MSDFPALTDLLTVPGAVAAAGSSGISLLASPADHLHAGGIVRIGKIVLGTAATNITFSSIPGTYSHLLLIASVRSDAAAVGDAANYQLNGDTAAHYATNRIQNNNTLLQGLVNSSSTSGILFHCAGGTSRASMPAAGFAFFEDYAGTLEKHATSLSGYADSTTANDNMGIIINSWESTAAITSIKFFPSVGTNFVAGSAAALYGFI